MNKPLDAGKHAQNRFAIYIFHQNKNSFVSRLAFFGKTRIVDYSCFVDFIDLRIVFIGFFMKIILFPRVFSKQE